MYKHLKQIVEDLEKFMEEHPEPKSFPDEGSKFDFTSKILELQSETILTPFGEILPELDQVPVQKK